MNRPGNASTTSPAPKHQSALLTARTLLLGAITIVLFAFICLFIAGNSLDTSPRIAAASSETDTRLNATRTTPAQARQSYGQLPLSFEANRGQASEAVNFVARGAGYTIALSPSQASFVLA